MCLTFTVWPYKAWHTLTTESIHFINTFPLIVTGIFCVAIVVVAFTELTLCPGRTGTYERVHLVMTGTCK